jgi:hypothetical protein
MQLCGPCQHSCSSVVPVRSGAPTSCRLHTTGSLVSKMMVEPPAKKMRIACPTVQNKKHQLCDIALIHKRCSKRPRLLYEQHTDEVPLQYWSHQFWKIADPFSLLEVDHLMIGGSVDKPQKRRLEGHEAIELPKRQCCSHSHQVLP